MTARIRGSCHCANVRYELTWTAGHDIRARRCGCSFCRKHGGVWTSDPAGVLTVRIARPTRTSRYEFETATAQFLVCSDCGVVPLVTSTIGERVHAVVNAHTLDDVDPSRIEIAPASFDGEALGDRLARRQRYWIPDVRFEE